VFYAYILRSESNPKRFYYGFTADLKTRLQAHNEGANHSTRAHRPWMLAWYAAFENEQLARSFEAYLKTASGKAFARKRLLRVISDSPL
jgi:putative endonuclease